MLNSPNNEQLLKKVSRFSPHYPTPTEDFHLNKILPIRKQRGQPRIQGTPAPIQIESTNIHYIALRKVRETVKGVRISYIPIILAVGCGFRPRIAHLAQMLIKSPAACFNNCVKLKKMGFIVKDGKHYYLTERGQQVYDIFTMEYSKQFDKLLARIRKELLEELAKERLG